MAEQTRPCVGGPHDGRSAGAAREHVAFIDLEGRCFAGGGKGRAMYRQDGRMWLYCGEGAYRCRCGAYVIPKPPDVPQRVCPICGARRPRRRSATV